MRSVRIGDGIREGWQTLGAAWRLIRQHWAATLPLWLLLALAPGILQAFLAGRAYSELFSAWYEWINAFMKTGQAIQPITSLLAQTYQASSAPSIWALLVSLAKSLLLSPLLLTALALLYNGYVLPTRKAGWVAVKRAGQNVRNLVVVALVCMLANWLVQIIPALASNILTLLAELVSWIPVVGTAVGGLAAVLSVFVSLATDFAVIVIFSYVWICIACEGVSGFAAFVRSWQLTRNALHRTISSLLMLTLLRWAAVIVWAAAWILAGRPLGIPIEAVVYGFWGIAALHTVCMGAATSALYKRRPVHSAPQPGQFRPATKDY